MPRFPRRRKGRDEDDEPAAGRRDRSAAKDDNVDLGGEANAWWSERELSRAWEPSAPDADPEPDPLDEHLGDRWREEFGLEDPAPEESHEPPVAPVPPAESTPEPSPEPAPEPAPEPEPPPPSAAQQYEAERPAPERPRPEPTPLQTEFIPDLEATNPYAVLGIESSATWEQILVAHRTLARRYHPDKVATFDEMTRGHAEDIMFKINSAYRDLKIRRGK